MAIAPIILAAAMAATNTVPHTIPAPDAPLGRTERIEQDLSDMRGVILDLQAQLDSIRMADVREAFIKPDRSWEDGVYIGEKDTFENLGSDDVKVGVDSSATPDYIGATSSTGAIHTDGSITKTSSGNFVTLSVNGTYVGTNITYDCDAIETCIGTPWDVYATNHTDLLFTGSGAIGTGKSGGNTDHDDSYWHTYNDGQGGAHTNYIDGKDYATTGTVSVGAFTADSVQTDSVIIGTPFDDFILLNTNSIAADLAGAVQIISDGDMNMYTESTGDAFFGAVGSGAVAISANTGDISVNGANLLFTSTTAVKIDTITAASVAEGSDDLFIKGFFVNEGAWVVTTITNVFPAGTTNIYTVLAKP